MNSKYYKYATAYLFALNLIQMRQVRRLFKAGKEVRTQRDDLVGAVYEMTEIRETLSRILNEHDIELEAFDRVLLENNAAQINSLLGKYTEESAK